MYGTTLPSHCAVFIFFVGNNNILFIKYTQVIHIDVFRRGQKGSEPWAVNFGKRFVI